MTNWDALDLKFFDTVVLMGAVEGAWGAGPEVTFQAERRNRFRRAVGGFDGVPVPGSKFLSAVFNNGEVAKLRIRWPRFVIDPRIKENVQAFSRKTIENAVYEAGIIETAPLFRKTDGAQQTSGFGVLDLGP